MVVRFRLKVAKLGEGLGTGVGAEMGEGEGKGLGATEGPGVGLGNGMGVELVEQPTTNSKPSAAIFFILAFRHPTQFL